MADLKNKVYRAVLSIPLGQVKTYKWLATVTGNPQAVRAVARVLASNGYPVFIPCHRIIKSNGQFGGYALGFSLKKELIVLERKIAWI
jgi:O-6-methylguanine DNA methyltransferase